MFCPVGIYTTEETAKEVMTSQTLKPGHILNLPSYLNPS